MILALAALVWVAGFLVTGWIVLRRGTQGSGLASGFQYLGQHDAIRDVLAIGSIGAATGLFFWRLLAGQVWMPAGGGDLAQFLYPTYSFAAEWWRRGVVPLWNPYLFAGAPFVGDIQSGIFYPLNLLTFLISSPLAFRDMEFLSVLHYAIAGAGMYAFLRYGKLGFSASPEKRDTSSLSRLGCLAGAIAFEFSDLFITHFGNLNLIAVAAWTPLVLLFYRRSVLDRRIGFAALAGIVMAVAFFAGHIQSFLFIVIALIAFALYHWVAAPPVSQSEQRPWYVVAGQHPIFLLGIVALAAFGLAAPFLLPSLEMTTRTVRAAFSYEQAVAFSLPPAQLIGLFVPGFFGRGPTNAWGPWDRVEVGYIGILPLALGLLAILLRRDALTRFFGVLALLGLALALGGYAILHGWLYQFVPFFGQLRVPARFIFLFDFPVAVLAAFGFDALQHTLPDASERVLRQIARGAPWVLLIVAVATGGTAYAILILGQGQDAALFTRMGNAVNALAFFILLLGLTVAIIVARSTRFFHPRAWAILALVLIFFDLFSLGAYVDASTLDPAKVYDHPDAVAFLKENVGLSRIDPRGTGVDNAWTPDAAIFHQLFSIDGDNPLVLADFDRYWQSLGSRSTALYDMLNIGFLIGRKGVPLDRDKFRLAYDGDPAFDIFENTRALPRAWIVSQSEMVPDQSSAFAAIHEQGFDPARTVILEGQKGGATGQDAVQGPEPSAKITGYGPNEIVLDTVGGGWLVLSEVYYPGWRAWVNDREVQVNRADYLFRAIELSSGTHHVRLLYDPPPFKIGVALFFVTVLVLSGWAVTGRFRQRMPGQGMEKINKG